MSVIYCDNDNDIILQNLQLADDFSPIVDAELSVSFGSIDTKGVITGATNATPIVITSAAHGLTTGDTVVISGVEGNLAANGVHVVTVIGANSFSLDDSVGDGDYAADSNATWYLGVDEATGLAMSYSASAKRYLAVVPGTAPFVAGKKYIRIVNASNYNVHWEETVVAQVRR